MRVVSFLFLVVSFLATVTVDMWICIICQWQLLVWCRTFQEISKSEELYKKCHELSEALAEDMQAEQIVVRLLYNRHATSIINGVSYSTDGL